MECILKIKARGSLSAIYYIIKYYKYHEIEPFKYFLYKNYFFCINSKENLDRHSEDIIVSYKKYLTKKIDCSFVFRPIDENLVAKIISNLKSS